MQPVKHYDGEKETAMAPPATNWCPATDFLFPSVQSSPLLSPFHRPLLTQYLMSSQTLLPISSYPRVPTICVIADHPSSESVRHLGILQTESCMSFETVMGLRTTEILIQKIWDGTWTFSILETLQWLRSSVSSEKTDIVVTWTHPSACPMHHTS